MRHAQYLPRLGVAAALLCAASLAAQPAERQRVAPRVLLVPRVWADTLTQPFARAVVEAASHTQGSFSLVPMKEFAMVWAQPEGYPEKFEHIDLRETRKLVHAGRYVAVTRSAGALDSLCLVISGVGCTGTVDSLTLLRALPVRDVLQLLSAHLDREPQ